MVSSRNEGGAQVLSASVRKTILSIKEVVRSHSDADIYVALKECNMDPNETIQKLLHQDPFHEVKRKRDKKKENSDSQNLAAVEHKINSEPVRVPVKQISYPDRSVQNGGYSRKASSDAGAVREFRVVRDNRINQNIAANVNSAQSSTLIREGLSSNLPLKRNSTGTTGNQKLPVEHQLPQSLNRQEDLLSRQEKVVTSSTGEKKVLPGEKQNPMPNVSTPLQTKTNDAQQNITNSSHSHVVGVYSSFSDPVHVPSRHSRPTAGVGAIRREVGVVGTRRKPFEHSSKPFSSQTLSNTKTTSGRDSHSKESTRPVNSISKSDQFNQKTAPNSALPLISVSRSSSSNHHGHHHGGRTHQLSGHQKAPQPNKEWKPKTSLKSSANGTGIFGTDAVTGSPADNSDGLIKGEVQILDKICGLNISDKQNVIIAAHIRVTESDRRRLTFGSLGIDIGSTPNSVVVSDEGAVKSSAEPSGSVPVPLPESTEHEPAGAKLLGLMDEPVQSSGSNSPASGVMPDHLIENIETQNLDKSVDVGLVQGENQSYPPESLQQQVVSEVPSFSGYDSQIVYDMSYFRPMVEEAVRGPDLQPSEEVSNSHMINNIPASTFAMVQQQQLAQMYPSVHVSHYANLMPYRQFISPVYVPPVPMPGYSNSPAYTHPSSGSSYLLMPGNSTHLTQSGLKYGVQQFKPVPTGNPNGFGNFPSPTGYAINTPGVGNAGHEDSSRLKFKDSLYVTNPQADTNEIWMNTRDLPSLQSASYYNLPAQTPHAAYLSSHGGHASFNPANAQSSHMQFPGMYHPPTRPVAIASPHHLVPAIGGNVGVGAPAPGSQVGAYQQPQLGNLNWNGNF